MDPKIREYLVKFNIENEYGVSDDDLIETLLEEEEVYRKRLSSHRWWNDLFIVVNVGGKLIGYDYAETTGDSTPEEVGWEFNAGSICEVEAKEVTKTIYVRNATNH